MKNLSVLLAAIALLSSSHAFSAGIHRVGTIDTQAGRYKLDVKIYTHTDSGIIGVQSYTSDLCEPCDSCLKCTTNVKHSGASILATLTSESGTVLTANQDVTLEANFDNPFTSSGKCEIAYPKLTPVTLHHPHEFMEFTLPSGMGEIAVSINMTATAKLVPQNMRDSAEAGLVLNESSIQSAHWFHNVDKNTSYGGSAQLIDPAAPVPADEPWDDRH